VSLCKAETTARVPSWLVKSPKQLQVFTFLGSLKRSPVLSKRCTKQQQKQQQEEEEDGKRVWLHSK
jgi:hypothetical protein